MAYLAREAITKGWWLSGIYSRRLQTIDGADMTNGLSLLNDLIADKTQDIGLIPFYKETTFETEQGEERYTVEGLIDVDTETFSISNTRFGTQQLSRRQFFGSSRQDNVQSLPMCWHPERILNGTDIYLYPVPNEVYTIKIWGKFSLDEVESLDTDLSTIYERGYINYMTYKLAKFLCDQNGYSFLPGPTEQLAIYEKSLSFESPIDLSTTKVSTLTSDRTFVDLPNPLFNGWIP